MKGMMNLNGVETDRFLLKMLLSASLILNAVWIFYPYLVEYFYWDLAAFLQNMMADIGPVVLSYLGAIMGIAACIFILNGFYIFRWLLLVSIIYDMILPLMFGVGNPDEFFWMLNIVYSIVNGALLYILYFKVKFFYE